MPKRLIVARHGQTEWNKEFRFQGRTNIQLTDEGKRQAQLLATRLQSWPPEIIYTSPLDRAKFTALAIASPLGLTPITLPELEEIDFGTWEGQSLKMLEQEQPELYNRWRSDPFFNPPDGGETWPEIESRLTQAVNIMLSTPHEHIVAVTHGGIIRALYAVIMRLDPHHTWYMDVGNCAMSCFEFVDGRPYLSFTNDSHHIKPLWGEEE